MRSTTIIYSDGTQISTSLAANLTDKEIKEYYAVGKTFNIGTVTDNLQTVIKCEVAPLKGLIVEVYRSIHSDPNSGGITSRVNYITLCGEGLPELFEANDEWPAFKVVKRNLSDGEYIHVEPWERPDGRGWMYGGNICSDSDSRFPNKYPLKIHDRQEF